MNSKQPGMMLYLSGLRISFMEIVSCGIRPSDWKSVYENFS